MKAAAGTTNAAAASAAAVVVANVAEEPADVLQEMADSHYRCHSDTLAAAGEADRCAGAVELEEKQGNEVHESVGDAVVAVAEASPAVLDTSTMHFADPEVEPVVETDYTHSDLVVFPEEGPLRSPSQGKPGTTPSRGADVAGFVDGQTVADRRETGSV